MKMNRLRLNDSEAEQIGHVLKKHRRFKRWKKTVGMLALAVLVVSGYAMMRPAITMEQDNFCGQSPEVSEEITASQETEPEAETEPETPEPQVPAETEETEPGAQEPQEPTETEAGEAVISEAADEAEPQIPAQIDAAAPDDAADMEVLAVNRTPQDQSRFVDKLKLSKTKAVSGDEITLTVGFAWKEKDHVKAGDYIVVTWPETGTARLDCTSCPGEVKYRNLSTVIATTAHEPGRLTITFNEAVEGVSLPDRWAILELKFTAVVESGSPEHSAALTIVGGQISNTVTVEKAGDYYSVYDTSADRKVTDPNGNLDADWSLCLNHSKDSPGTATEPSGGYVKIVNPTEEQYKKFSGDNTAGNFQRVKRILYAKAALYPDYNYGVFQNELYYAITGIAKYDTTWQTDELNTQKADIRAAADSDAHDTDIEERLEVVIYSSNNSSLQNTITAKLKEPPPPPGEKVSIPVEKVWDGTPAESVTVHLFANGNAYASKELSEQNNWKCVFENLDKYDSAGNRINYTLKEVEVPGYESVITGGCDFGACGFTVTNTEIGTVELTVKKIVTGAGGDTNKEFHFTINIVNGGTHPLPGTYQAYLNDEATNVVVDDDGNANITLKHNDTLKITGIQSGFYYIITEAEAGKDGYTTTVERSDHDAQDDERGGVNNWGSDDGAESNVEVTFTNRNDNPAYHTDVVARKTLGGGLPRDGQFTFILTDSNGQEAGRRTNDAQGDMIFPLELPGPGTYTYTLREQNDGQGGIIYDEHACKVEVKAEAPAEPGGLPVISVTYDGADGPAQFSNQYSYLLPETGGAGINGYIGGGMALTLASLLALYIIKLVRRKEGCS